MRNRITTILALAALAAVAPAGAQTAPGGTITSWSPFLGCWSTSSAGAIGPMVCVVPTDVVDRVEFLTVDGDSVVKRASVDASGKRVAAMRPGCDGWESGRWSNDGRRLLMHAEYRCGGSATQRSDAILSLSQSDAFTHVERNTTREGTPTSVVNFMVQLDTTVFPVEVRRRLPYWRPLAVEMSELETIEQIPAAAIVEAASDIDPTVVQLWLADRGQLSPETSTMIRVLRVASLGRELPSPMTRFGFVDSRLSRFGAVRLQGQNVVYLTADHGIIPEPIGGLWTYWNRSFSYNPSEQLSFPYRWP